MIRLVFKITPGCEIDKLYSQYEKAHKAWSATVKKWMAAHNIKEWMTSDDCVVSVVHPLFDRENHKWLDGRYGRRHPRGESRSRVDLAPPHPGLICLKKNSIYEYSPNRLTTEGKELIKLWKSWNLDDTGKDKALALAIDGQGVGFMPGGTARDGLTIYSAALWRLDGELYAIIPRDKPFRSSAKDMTEVVASTVIK